MGRAVISGILMETSSFVVERRHGEGRREYAGICYTGKPSFPHAWSSSGLYLQEGRGWEKKINPYPTLDCECPCIVI